MTTPREHQHRRVLVVIRWPVGGIRTHIQYYYPRLMRAGYRFTFVGPADESFRSFCAGLRDWDQVEFVEAPVHKGRCRFWGPVRRLLREGRFDLIHSHGVIAALQVAVANLGLGLPHVVTSHDVFRPAQFPGFAGRAKLWLMTRLLGRTDAIVTVSEDARENLIEYLPGIERSRCRLPMIFTGINVDRFSENGTGAAHELRGRLGIGREVFLIGFLGRLIDQKGFLPLLSAIEGLGEGETAAPFHLVAVGSGDLMREYRWEAKQRGLEGKVSFVEAVADAGPILRQLDLLVMPSLWEACPALPMEAMVAGVPVLGSDCIGLREVLRGSPSRMVPTGDAEALRQGLRQAIALPWTDEARAYAPEARRRFNAAHSAEKLRQIFDELVARPHDPAEVTHATQDAPAQRPEGCVTGHAPPGR